ncbi:hypothetical protein BH23PLA1_BH23PLA1_37460 [soil metagenome]
MKQLLFMITLTLVGTVGCLVRPFYGVAIYYLFAVLRPQFLWLWSLPSDIQWSRFVALASLGAVLIFGSGARPDAATGPTAIKLGRAHRLFALNFLWLCVAYFTAYDRDYAFPYFNEYIKIFVMLGVATVAARMVIDLWALLIIAAASLAYIAYEVNSLYFNSGYLGIYRNGYGGLDNNGAGLMLAMGVPLCLAVWDTLRSHWRWFFLAMIPVLIHAVLMTYSRGAMLSLLVAVPVLLVRTRHRAQIGLIALTLTIWGIPIMAGPEIRARFMTMSDQEVDESANSRKASWKAAWLIAQDNPVFGVGIRNANLFSYEYGADMQNRTIHNNYLQIAADTGFPGIGLYLAMLGAVWLDTRRVRRCCRSREDLESRRLYGIAYGVEGSMAVFCIGAVFLSLENFELPFLLLFLGAQAGAVVRERDSNWRTYHVDDGIMKA